MADGESLRDVGEHPFLARLCHRLTSLSRADDGMLRGAAGAVLVGPGDDAAVLRTRDGRLALTTDALVEGVHFQAGWLTPEELGCRAIAAALSDLAAMGARPTATLVALQAPPDTAVLSLDSLLDACARASAQEGAVLIGGNLTRGPVLSVTVTALGEVEGECLCRSGARPGDRLLVTGSLGDAAAAVAAWQEGSAPEPALRRRYAHPQARIAAGRALAAAGAHAAIDVSDGLLADLGHLCAASGVGAEVRWDLLPRSHRVAALDAAGDDLAATGGEDYELLAACAADLTDGDLERLAAVAGVPLTVIGCCTAAPGIRLLDAQGLPHRLRAPAGFDHFTPAADRGAR